MTLLSPPEESNTMFVAKLHLLSQTKGDLQMTFFPPQITVKASLSALSNAKYIHFTSSTEVPHAYWISVCYPCMLFFTTLLSIFNSGCVIQVVGDFDEVAPNGIIIKSRTVLIRQPCSSTSYISGRHFYFSKPSLDGIYCCNVQSGFGSYWSFSNLKFNYRLVIAPTFSSCPAPVGLIMQSN